MRALRWFGLPVAALLVVLGGAWFWLLHTTSGAGFVLGQAGKSVALRVATVDGSFGGGLLLGDIRFVNESVDVRVAEMSVTVDPGLLPLAVTIQQASARDISIGILEDAAKDDDDTDVVDTLESLVLPFPVSLDEFRADTISITRGDERQAIDSLILEAVWYEDIRVEHFAVRTSDVDAAGDVVVDLGRGNAITGKVLATLKPALTRMSENLSVEVRSEGDLAGANVFATVDTFATITGEVHWRDGLDARADVSLKTLDLSGLVDNWPQGFPIDGDLRVIVNDDEIALRESVIAIDNTDARIAIDASMERAGDVIRAHLHWERLRWPLPLESTRVRSDSADLRLAGTVDDWTASGRIAIAADELPPGVFEIDGKGNRNSASGRIVDSEVLGGRVAGEVSYTWSDPRPWLAKLDLTSVQLAWLVPEWPAVVSGRIESHGTGDPFVLHATVSGVEGELRDLPLRAAGVVDIADGNVVVSNVGVRHGESEMTVDGALMSPRGLDFELRIADLGVYVADVAGAVEGVGSISLAETDGFLDASLASADIGLGGLDFADVEATLRADNDRQALQLFGEHLGTAVTVSLDGAFADWRRPLETRFVGTVEAFEIDLDDEHSMLLAEAAPLEFDASELALREFCLVDQDGSRACADVDWQRDGDYGLELDLQDVSLALVEHAVDSPLLFDQRVSGTFAWRHKFGAGPRGSGRVTLSAGTISPVDDPQSAVATGEGAVDFDIEQGRLLRGDFVLPFPGRGDISGGFSIDDVRLGAASGVAGNLDVDISTIRALSRLTRLVDNASGALRASVDLAGTVADPLWTGELSLDNGSFTYEPIGLELTEVTLDGAMDSDLRIDVNGTFRSGRGVGEIVSRADYSNADKPGLMFKLRGDRLTLVNVPDVFVETDANVDISLDRDTLTINGELNVPNALVKPRNITAGTVNESEDVIIVAGELPDPPEGNVSRGDLDYRGQLNVTLGESVIVDLDLAKANVSGAVNFDWKGDRIPIANGRYLIGGSIEAFGQVLEISEGSIHFPNVPADQPNIRIVAEREIFGNTQVKRAGVLIDGPVRRPIVEAFTQPMTSEERALTLLVTGSDFDYEQGVGAIDFGTYIAPRLFVSYGVGVFERENIISARFDLAKGFGIKASSGSKESGIDLNYRFEN